MANEIIDQLKQAFLFRDLPEEMLATLSGTVHLRNLQKDDFLFRKGDAGDSLFVIGKGRMKITAEDAGGGELTINPIEAGEVVGEVSLFDQAPRSASIVALEDAEVLELEREDFLKLINQNPDLVLPIMLGMSKRMRDNMGVVQKVTEWSKKIAEGDFSFAEQKKSDLLADASDEDRAGKSLSSEFFAMARKMKEQVQKTHAEQMREIEHDLRAFLPAKLYAELYVSDWADQNPNAPMPIDPRTGREITIEIQDGAKLKPVFDHLATLQTRLAYYLSVLVKEKRIESADLRLTRRSGALLFTDLAGFTKLMEANADQGQEGAERLMGNLNKYFTDMAEIITKSGGELLEFAGDALFVWFPDSIRKNTTEEEKKKKLDGAVSKAVRTGLRMQRKMKESYDAIETPQGPLQLQMRIGVHAGSFYSANVGTPHRRDHILLGEAVLKAKQTEGAGEKGRVNLSTEAYNYLLEGELKGLCRYNETDRNYRLVHDDFGESLGDHETLPPLFTISLASTTLFEKRFTETYKQIKELLASVKNLASFVSSPLLSVLVENVKEIPPDFPSPTMMFLNLLGLHKLADTIAILPDEVREVEEHAFIQSLSVVFANINARVEAYGGMLKKVSCHTSGSYMIISFGVPAAYTDNSIRAAKAALDIMKYMSEYTLPDAIRSERKIICKIGITAGKIFAADVGAKTRREFNFHSDTVNTAARLMDKAGPYEILIGETVQQAVSSAYETDSLGVVSLKGKSPISVYKLLGRKS